MSTSKCFRKLATAASHMKGKWLVRIKKFGLNDYLLFVISLGPSSSLVRVVGDWSVLLLVFMTGRLDELESCKSATEDSCFCVWQALHVALDLKHCINFSRTFGVKTQKRRAFTKPCAESPIPCIKCKCDTFLHLYRLLRRLFLFLVLCSQRKYVRNWRNKERRKKK